MCFSFKFFTSFMNSPSKSGDAALIVKKRPTSLAQGAVQLFTDSDVFSIDFNQAAQLTPAQKATVLSAQLLADYMYFDGNTDKCSYDGDTLYCYCFYCSIIGYICPCYIAFKASG
jgi:hypothetical protein